VGDAYPDAHELDGIAEIHFPTERDLRERFYDSEAGRRAIREDVAGFIDRTRGWPMRATETIVRSPPSAAAWGP
jgi:hypothetical protein